MDKSQMPMEALLQILQDSLEKKIDLLGTIEEKSKEQEIIIKKENFTFQEMDENMDAVEALAFLNRELFAMIDNRVSLELLARLLSSQLVTRGDKHLLDRNRTYFKLLHRIVRRGQERGELRRDLTANEIVKGYAMFERALMYDWCLVGGEYALNRYAAVMMPTFLEGYRQK